MIKSIPTKYKGHRFRSRLEARWAGFFDDLKIEWAYEPRRFQLYEPFRQYTPDFYFIRSDCYVEIKPFLQLADMEAMQQFRDCTGRAIILLASGPGNITNCDFHRANSRPCHRMINAFDMLNN